MQFFRKVPVLAAHNGEIALHQIAVDEVAPPFSFGYSNEYSNRAGLNHSSHPVVLGAVVFGVLAGVAASAYWWRNRVRAEILQATPLERVEDLIASCESKIEDIERSIENLKKDGP